MIVGGQLLSVVVSGGEACGSADVTPSGCRNRTDRQEEGPPKWRRSPARRPTAAGATSALVGAVLIVALASATVKLAEARYIHSTYRFSPSYVREQPFGDDGPAGGGGGSGMARRQDYEGDEGDGDADDDGDQSAAASYRNQDDNGGGGGDGAGSGDSYGDNETDGPYDETPNEQEGQADLERFFDDHLGASDREGMDKENLPTNLVSLLANAPAQLSGLGDGLSGGPPGSGLAMDQVPEQLPTQLTAVPLLPVINPTVQPRSAIRLAHESLLEPLSSLPTIQTSFIRLPDEKMIITHQVTARNAGAPTEPANHHNQQAGGGGVGVGPPRPLKFFADERDGSVTGTSGSGPDQAGGDQQDDASRESQRLTSEMAAALDGQGWHLLPQLIARQQLRISPTESLTNISTGNLAPIGGGDGAPQPMGASSSNSNDVFATEDEDFDRVYVTNETSRPFRIDALGGFDPEEDFIDAAKELEVMASDDNPGRARARGASAAAGTGTGTGAGASPAPSIRGLKRRSNQAQDGHDHGAGPRRSRMSHSDSHGGSGDGEASEQQHQQQRGDGGAQQPGQEVSFNDPETDMMYEDASETDEVTFGQDDPYQTDLEAEMRQQEYDKLSPSKQTNDQPSVSGSLNVAVDNGAAGPNGGTSHAGQQVGGGGGGEDDDIDADMDNEYRPELNARQRESMAAAAAAAAFTKSAQVPRPRNDIDDEGAWVNDGVDEMDIPSQSHQNSVLDKAEQRADVAAAAEQAAKNDEDDGKQPLADGGAAPGAGQDESGQTNDNGEENVRMPNADNLKNDFVEDDSGYAAA